ncbi:Tap42 interacting protein [Malassezia cuniculi]|uniref:Tap42 interacting protein n=1 Tax=Malassezia cuniculi TaxID=948313 RepID=A0AAF0J7W1_9BASI|nr:Tap42 interacting protein [Malassezia cuniculi]
MLHREYERVHQVQGTSPADVVTERGITIGPWTICAFHGSIANAAELDRLGSVLGITPPEMPFPHNALTIKHESGFTYHFDAESALRCVGGVRDEAKLASVDCAAHFRADVSGISFDEARAQRKPGFLKVAYADNWGTSRNIQGAIAADADSDASNFCPGALPSTVSTSKEYDWTYSSTWPGLPTAAPSGRGVFVAGTDPARDRIPTERLAPSCAPIIFYDDLVLYEDELGDNGSSMLNVKVRVMPHDMLVLQRFFLRVDDVVFRVFDTRLYISFRAEDGDAIPTDERTATDRSATRPRIIRECRGAEASYADVRARLPPHRPNDLSPLTDVNWVAAQLQALQEQQLRKNAGPC